MSNSRTLATGLPSVQCVTGHPAVSKEYVPSGYLRTLSMVANKVRTYMQQILGGKATFLHIIRNLVEIYGTQIFITGFHNSPLRFAIMSQINLFHALPHFFFRYTVILSSLLQLDLPSGLFHSGFRTKSLLSSIRATCQAHLLRRHMVPRNTSSEEYKSQSSPLRNLHHFLPRHTSMVQ